MVCAWIYSIGLACDMVCYLLADGVLSARYIWTYPKIKQFSRLNLGYMQKTVKNIIFCIDICKTTQKIKIENHACTCAICIYHPENRNRNLSNIYRIRKS